MAKASFHKSGLMASLARTGVGVIVAVVGIDIFHLSQALTLVWPLELTIDMAILVGEKAGKNHQPANQVFFWLGISFPPALRT